MRHQRLEGLVLLCLAAGLAVPFPAAAAGFGLFQHGGRAMGQAGAFTARASEPSAVFYNPAAIVRLEGLQAQAGLDFDNSEDTYSSPTGRFSASHVIQFQPALYATWKPENSSWALGIGLDTPFWYRLNWRPVLFPGRFLQRTSELRVWELHPVVAYDLGGGWSLGGGLRYLYGTMEQEDNGLIVVDAPAPNRVEVERNAEADVDAFTWDLALHYAAPAWGWGVVLREKAELKGNGDVSYEARDVPPALGDVARRLRNGDARLSFELPRELRGGIWYAPYPELRLEVDASWQTWSSLENTDVTYSTNPFGASPLTETTRRDWEDTVSLRLGVEGDITENFMLFGGVAFEPSPVPGHTLEPGFPRGDAIVYAAGMSYSFPRISFDLGYSFHDHEGRNADGQELLNPRRTGRYSGEAQVWGFAVRWRL